MIETQSLTRRFGDRVAVENLSFSLAEGQVVGLLGPNGAGKTTTLRMLGGLIAPSSGSAMVCGQTLGQSDAANRAIRARCGNVPEVPGFYERLSARDNLLFYAGLHRLKDASLRVDSALQRFGLAARGEDRVSTYSKGMKQRLSIARALIHEPQLVLLDEPSAGLDPQATAAVHALIRELKAKGTSLVLCTHSLEEVEALADQVLILDRSVRFAGALSDFCEVADTVIVDMQINAMPEGLTTQSVDATRYTFAAAAESIPELVRRLIAAGADIRSVTQQRRSLRQRYLELVGDR